MYDFQPPKPKRRWFQFSLRTLLVLVLLTLSGCGPSKEQQAVDAYNRGLARYHKGELDEAIADYTEAIRLDPQLAYAYYGRGNAYYKKGDFDKAIADYTETIRFNPKYAEAYLYRGIAYFDVDDYENAVADLTEVLRLDPTNVSAYYERGLAHLTKGDYDSAVHDFSKRLEVHSEASCARCYRGFALAMKGEEAAAERDFSEVLRHDPDHSKRHLALAFDLGNRGQREAEIREFTIVIRLDPQSDSAYAGRAIALRELGKAEEAIADCNEAIRLEYRDAIVYAIRGQAHADRREYEDAIADCTEALRLDADCFLAWEPRARSRLMKGDFDGAIADGTKAIQFAQDDYSAFLTRGRAYAAKRDFENAMADFTTAVQLTPAQPHAYLLRASAYWAIGDEFHAAADERAALELADLAGTGAGEPDSEPDRHARAQLTANSELVAQIEYLGPAMSTAEGVSADWSPDGERVSFLKSHFTTTYTELGGLRWMIMNTQVADLWTVRADGSEPCQITRWEGCHPVHGVAYPTRPRWSPGGGSLAYLSGHALGGQVVLLDVPSRQAVELDYSATSIRWSPDGESLAIVGCKQKVFTRPQRQLLVGILDVDGSTFREIAEVSNAEIGDWAPDGRQFLYTTWKAAASHAEWAITMLDESRREESELWVANVDGSVSRCVATHVMGPGIWSPDGEWIAYSGDRSQPGVWKMSLATQECVPVIEEPLRFAQWIHGGEMLLCLTEDNEKKTDLFLLEICNGRKQRVTTSGNVVEAVPSPDGSRVIVIGLHEAAKPHRDSYLLTLKNPTGDQGP
jgi:tetratricopeptide (TPR) repeat protein